MEAMANGVPVMASDIRGNIDLITHGENGILFTSTIDLIDLFKDVFSDNLPMNKYIQRANETVKGYSEGIVSKQINEIYRN